MKFAEYYRSFRSHVGVIESFFATWKLLKAFKKGLRCHRMGRAKIIVGLGDVMESIAENPLEDAELQWMRAAVAAKFLEDFRREHMLRTKIERHEMEQMYLQK